MTRDPMAGVTIDDYRTEDSDEALGLERACPQGRGLRLGFRRPSFHARAAAFDEHRVLVARLDGRMVGTQAAAIKDVALGGRRTRGAFLFDLRVHPDVRRRRGIGRFLAREVLDWSLARAEVVYTYTMFENRAVVRISRALGAAPAGGYAYLVVPTALLRRPRCAVSPVPFADAEGRYRSACGELDLDTRPSGMASGAAYRGSWLVGGDGGAGCSAWDNRRVLAEVVEGLPRGLALLGRLQRALPWTARFGIPPIPQKGQPIRSWYLFDFFAQSPRAGFDLLRGVASAARASAIDYLYVVHVTEDPIVAAIRRRLPRAFTPVVPYRLLARGSGGPAGPFARLHVDARDL